MVRSDRGSARPILTALLVCFVAGGVARAEGGGPTWQRFTSKAGRFTVEVPAPPKEQEQALGPLVLRTAIATFRLPGKQIGSCGVTFTDLGAALPPGAGPAYLEQLLAPSKQDPDTKKILDDRVLALGKHAGRSLVIDNTRDREWRQVYLVGPTQFILFCAAPVEQAAPAEPVVKRFFASFTPTAP